MDPNTKSKDFAKFPFSNFCIEDGILSLIDFEMAAPIDSLAEQRLSDRLPHHTVFIKRKNLDKHYTNVWMIPDKVGRVS